MNGTMLRIYVQENRKHQHVLLYEWLLEAARGIGIPGGSAFRALAGYGRGGRLHEEHFFELAGELPIAVEFVATADECDRLVALLHAEGIDAFHVRTVVEYGSVMATAAGERSP